MNTKNAPSAPKVGPRADLPIACQDRNSDLPLRDHAAASNAVRMLLFRPEPTLSPRVCPSL